MPSRKIPNTSQVFSTINRLLIRFESDTLNARRFRHVMVGIAFLLLSVGIGTTAQFSGLLTFTPDSWSVYELANTVFSGDFYVFHTARSYFSPVHSAAFPLGYPVLVAIAAEIFSPSPTLAVKLNVVLALLSWLGLLRLGSLLRVSPLAAFLMATMLVLSSPYLDEVFAGRSMPAALFCFLLGGWGVLRGWSGRQWPLLFGGMALGGSILIRFDFLADVMLLLLATFLLTKRPYHRLWPLMLGTLIGVAPWVGYSLTYFGNIWVSDNAWVAVSALPANVLDYPASALIGARQAPFLWLGRVLSNIVPLLEKLKMAASSFPVLNLWPLSLFAYWTLPASLRWPAILLPLFASLAIIPYLLTGYLDIRYFTLLLLIMSGLIIYFIEHTRLFPRFRIGYALLQLCILVFCLQSDVTGIRDRFDAGFQNILRPDLTEHLINALERCQAGTPGVTSLFSESAIGFGFRYGAVTEQRSAIMPSNFNRLSVAGQHTFFRQLGPYRLINSLAVLTKCPSVIQP
ncbi:hypothetical protein [Deinococcus sp. UYEF24]